MGDSNGDATTSATATPKPADTVGSAGSTKVILNPEDKSICHEIAGDNVTIVTHAGSHTHGSSQVKLQNIVDYNWEKRNTGHLIAVHLDGKYIAFAIKVHKSGMVRVLNEQYSRRALIKGMTGDVLDIQFAHIEHKHLLATIDAQSLFVHSLETSASALECSLVLKIDDPLKNYTPRFDKVSWCPYVDVPDDEDGSQLLVWSRGSQFHCFSVSRILSEHPGVSTIKVDEIKAGYVGFSDKEMTITWVALSPDGSTLGIGSLDGVIRFYQIYMHDPDPRCLHQWKPHDGQPISSFFFLDNLNNNVSDTYWKYAITGGANNTELKVWDCGSWTCLQTIRMARANDDSNQQQLGFIAELDRSAEYLVLTSLESRTICVFQIVTPGSAASKKNGDAGKMEVYIKSVAEFPLNTSILSFSIVEGSVEQYKSISDNFLGDDRDDDEEYDDDANDEGWVVLRLFVVQPKSMQKCRIHYKPIAAASEKADAADEEAATPESQVATAVAAVKSPDKGPEMENGKKFAVDSNTLESFWAMNQGQAAAAAPSTIRPSEPEESANASPISSSSSKAQVNLMTPDAFSTTTNDKKTPDCVSSEVLNTLLMLANVANVGPNSAAAKQDISLAMLVNNTMIEDQEHKKQQKNNQAQLEAQKKFIAIDSNTDRNPVENSASGGSSPSREVQEILSLHEYDKSSYSGDELSDDTLMKTELEANPLADNVDMAAESAVDGATSTTATAGNSIAPQATPAAAWPKAPEVPKMPKHSSELQNAANLISTVAPPTLPPNVGVMNGNATEIADVNMKIDQLLDLVKLQSTQINSLQNEVADLKKSQQKAAAATPTTPASSGVEQRLEAQCVKLLDQALRRSENEHKKKLNAFMTARDSQQRDLRDQIVKSVTQSLLVQMREVMSEIFMYAIPRHVGPLVETSMGKLKEDMQMNLSMRFALFQKTLDENITQLCQNKAVVETFGKAVLEGVEGSFKATFIELMSSTLIPAYEKSSQHMFKQLHDTFSMGMKEFFDQFNQYMHILKPIQASSQEMVNQIGLLRQNVDVTLSKHCGLINETVLETRKDIKSQEILLSRIIQDSVRQEMRICLENQVATMRSQTATPAPMYDLKETIKILLSQKQYNKAFHQALLANDLALVEYTLKNADHHAVFNPTCCLEQKVILSLIQQISADMSNHNELKQNYLGDALLAINPRDPISHEHAPKVLHELYRNCQAFILNYPKSSQFSNVRMLMKLIQNFNEQF